MKWMLSSGPPSVRRSYRLSNRDCSLILYESHTSKWAFNFFLNKQLDRLSKVPFFKFILSLFTVQSLDCLPKRRAAFHDLSLSLDFLVTVLLIKSKCLSNFFLYALIKIVWYFVVSTCRGFCPLATLTLDFHFNAINTVSPPCAKM